MIASALADATKVRQTLGHHPGTSAARAAVVKLFVAFIKRVVSYTYAGTLSTSHPTPTHHVYHMRMFYKLFTLPDVSLHHYRVHLSLRAVSISIHHTLDPKHAVFPHILRRAAPRLHDQPHADPLILGVLLMFMGFMHQSSIVSASVSTLDPTRHLTRHDVTLTPLGLVIRLKWTKSIQKSADLKTFMLPHNKDRAICPVLAYQQYTRCNPLSARDTKKVSLLSFPDGNPLTIITRAWASALKQADISSCHLSLHSLRRGGVSYTHNDAGAKLNDVMAQLYTSIPHDL